MCELLCLFIPFSDSGIGHKYPHLSDHYMCSCILYLSAKEKIVWYSEDSEIPFSFQ